MPLHPIAEKFISTAKAAGARPVCGLTAEEAREASKQMFAFAPVGDPVAKVEDLSIPGAAGAIPARVYTPAGEGPLPILVYLHGGGWVLGDLESSDFECRAIANAAACIVVSVDYCLAPEHKFPAPAEDAYEATRWVAENAERLGGRPGAVAVGGMSAGGNLAAVVALMARDRGGPALACQLLIVPVTDCGCDTASCLDCGDDYLLTRDEMLYFWQMYLPAPEDGDHPYASPLRAGDLSGLPPARVHTAEFDPLRDEGRAYAEKLEAAGVPVSYECYDGMVHMVQGPDATRDLGAYLKQAFAQHEDTGVSQCTS
jgi:acetyl esterase